MAFEGDLGLFYRACLSLRCASRVLVELIRAPARDENDLYRLAVSHPWEEEFDSAHSFVCRVTGVPGEKDPRYAVLRLKDAIVDRFRSKTGQRPSVRKTSPDIRIEAHWTGQQAMVFLNWSGPPLHERGYRLRRTETVLRETTAAAVLIESNWASMGPKHPPFADPLCGSGTLLAEAASIAVDAPAGVHRQSWGFERLRRHKGDLWDRLRNEAVVRFGSSLENIPPIYGADNDDRALNIARSNLRRAGIYHLIRLEKHDIRQGRGRLWPKGPVGLICADPPYGLRTDADLSAEVYQALGRVFRTLDSGWRMAMLAPDRKIAAGSHLKADRYQRMPSGGLDLVLAIYSRLPSQDDRRHSPPEEGESVSPRRKPRQATESGAAVRPPARESSSDKTHKNPRPDAVIAAPVRLDPKTPSLYKALQRKLDALEPWARKTGTSCYRIWDAEMPEFNASVDWYERRWLVVQEFAAPKRIPPEKAERRRETLLAILKELTGCKDDNLFLKTRQRGIRPYDGLGGCGEKHIVREAGLRFLVNFQDYLDTGLFLDHRSTRTLIRSLADGRCFLNLFSYTGSATVMAAASGAKSSVSVDVSNTYNGWARDNLRINSLNRPVHKIVRADAAQYIASCQDRFELIFVDPPSYSNGAGRRDWSLQDHHGNLLRSAMRCLVPDGRLIFSGNLRGFELDQSLKKDYVVEDLTRETMPPDFAARSRAHRCWELTHRRR